jgi:hypothetical protein
MGHHPFLSKKHPYRAMDCQFNGEKENREASFHVTGDLVHLKVKDIKGESRGAVASGVHNAWHVVLVDIGCASFD